MTANTKSMQDWYADVPRSARMPTISGVVVLALMVVSFGYWGAMAPIAGAIIAAGAFVATGENKVIQHLEGGIIRQIVVREGDVVQPGQTLVQLDETSARTDLRRLTLRHAHFEAMQARLRAEAAALDTIAFPVHLTQQQHDDEIAYILDAQKLAFEARRANLKTEVAVLQSGIKALEERIQGGNVQLTSIKEQLTLIEEELEAKTSLLQAGLIRKPDVLALQRNQANLRGEIGRVTAEMGDAKERIARIVEQVENARSLAVQKAVEELHKVGAELVDLQEQIHSSRTVLDRVDITAPVEGIVVKLRYHTPGGVIEPGRDIMEILPLNAELVIEVQIRPADIDHVRRGQIAMVRLLAMNQRVTPMIPGEVIYVSADSLRNDGDRSANDIYIARVKLDAAEAAKAGDFNATPGMPAEVYIKTSERTFFEYLMQPLSDSMTRAFREP